MAAPRAGHLELLHAAVTMAARRTFTQLLVVCDKPLPEEILRVKRGQVRRKLLHAVTGAAQRAMFAEQGVRTVTIPAYEMAREERLRLALAAGAVAGHLRDGDRVLGLVGPHGAAYPDAIWMLAVGEGAIDASLARVGDTPLPAAVFEAIIDLAATIASQGWEGRPVGTLFVIGDTARVLEKSRPLTLNPFQGYSEEEKNLVNPATHASIKNFATLDGAFVVREDGVVLAAGRYLNFDQSDIDLPLGLGARHVAGAGISRDTRALAIAVSQDSGHVRLFRAGRIVLELAPGARRPAAPG